jgi:hypothetical protein
MGTPLLLSVLFINQFKAIDDHDCLKHLSIFRENE